jgi:chromosome segregation ATPase
MKKPQSILTKLISEITPEEQNIMDIKCLTEALHWADTEIRELKVRVDNLSQSSVNWCKKYEALKKEFDEYKNKLEK